MSTLKLFRRRIIPEECVLLKDDRILYQDREVIVTRWNTLKPKKTLHHGYSCYFLERGYKVSKFYDHSGNLISWYCDIVSHTFDEAENTYVFTDLLVDVVVYPDGFVRYRTRIRGRGTDCKNIPARIDGGNVLLPSAHHKVRQR